MKLMGRMFKLIFLCLSIRLKFGQIGYQTDTKQYFFYFSNIITCNYVFGLRMGNDKTPFFYQETMVGAFARPNLTSGRHVLRLVRKLKNNRAS